jgi:hypothetical protein
MTKETDPEAGTYYVNFSLASISTPAVEFGKVKVAAVDANREKEKVLYGRIVFSLISYCNNYAVNLSTLIFHFTKGLYVEVYSTLLTNTVRKNSDLLSRLLQGAELIQQQVPDTLKALPGLDRVKPEDITFTIYVDAEGSLVEADVTHIGISFKIDSEEVTTVDKEVKVGEIPGLGHVLEALHGRLERILKNPTP